MMVYLFIWLNLELFIGMGMGIGIDGMYIYKSLHAFFSHTYYLLSITHNSPRLQYPLEPRPRPRLYSSNWKWEWKWKYHSLGRNRIGMKIS